jgi:3'-phosphoadenosine 5'-phosphosulfate sulfotransferase (PAPS reductase)/FAD synthetase
MATVTEGVSMKKYIASVSFGKDSLAMLLKLIEKNMPLDEVVFYDTGMEFHSIYNNRDKVVKMLKDHNIKYTELYPKYTFLYNMFERPVMSKNGKIHYGYSWCGGRCRWGTTEKISTIEKYAGENFQYVGIAFDEQSRLHKNIKVNKLFPLAEWGMTEKDSLHYCYQKGFSWNEDGVELYNVLDRVSCWCCCNKNLKELKNYYLYLPKYWDKLKSLQKRTDRPMKYNKYSVFDLEEKFNRNMLPEV